MELMTTIIAWLALLAAIAAGLYAWKLSGELATAARRLDRYNKALFDAGDEIRRLREQVAEETAQLRVQLRMQQGASTFAPEMTVREALLVHPQVEQVLASFHLGGCSHCAVEPEDTLSHAATQHGVNLQALLDNLSLLTVGQPNQAAPQLVKLPNVVLELE
jgi:hybrid cluster-associated redox disulfide protein